MGLTSMAANKAFAKFPDLLVNGRKAQALGRAASARAIEIGGSLIRTAKPYAIGGAILGGLGNAGYDFYENGDRSISGLAGAALRGGMYGGLAGGVGRLGMAAYRNYGGFRGMWAAGKGGARAADAWAGRAVSRYTRRGMTPMDSASNLRAIRDYRAYRAGRM